MISDIALRMFFCGETQEFRSPEEPNPGDETTIRLRVELGRDVQAQVIFSTGERQQMVLARTDELFSYYEATFTCPDEPISYRIKITCDEGVAIYQRFGATWADADNEIDPRYDFRILPGFHTPQWSKGSVQYQIFVDRFCNLDPTNDVVEAEYSYGGERVKGTFDWDAPIANDDYRCFRGGDLAGVLAKLDYLQSIGVETIYLNPIFVSPSCHKYDIQDYYHIDPHYGVIVDDMEDGELGEGDENDAHAKRYIRRVTSEENLKASDALFERLCREMHRRGMRIIIDGVFNHTGSFNRWLDAARVYGGADAEVKGAYFDTESPWRAYYRFREDRPESPYDSWCGFETLPKLYYEESEQLQQEIVNVARHWVQPPYSVDGWRLDVAADLGYSEEFNHKFWRRFREGVKEVNPDCVLIAEHYGASQAWLDGTQWDTLMNYDAFMEPLSFFLTGVEKHSDYKRNDLYQNGDEFFESIFKAMCDYSWSSLACSMNQLSNHDHSRFLTRTNGMAGRMESRGQQAASEGIDKSVMREAVIVQMTWPGSPTLYYGDEAGLVGWTDPDNRRTYPWGHEDQSMIAFHRELAAMRLEHESLRMGELVALGCGYGWIAFGRFTPDDAVVTLVNNAETAHTVSIRVRDLGIRDGEVAHVLIKSDHEDFYVEEKRLGKVHFGHIQLTLGPRTALVLAFDK